MGWRLKSHNILYPQYSSFVKSFAQLNFHKRFAQRRTQKRLIFFPLDDKHVIRAAKSKHSEKKFIVVHFSTLLLAERKFLSLSTAEKVDHRNQEARESWLPGLTAQWLKMKRITSAQTSTKSRELWKSNLLWAFPRLVQQIPSRLCSAHHIRCLADQPTGSFSFLWC